MIYYLPILLKKKIKRSYFVLLLAGLINDAFALAKVGLLPYGTALDLTLYLGNTLNSHIFRLRWNIFSTFKDFLFLFILQ